MNTILQENAKVLIVEDESIIVKSLENRLIKAGYNVVGIAASGEEAVQLARLLNPNLILMDIKLQGEMTGIEAAQEIQKFLDCPVVYLTSYKDEYTFQQAKETNPFAYLHKPFDGEQLQRVLELTLTNHHIKSQLEQTTKRYEKALEAGNTAIWEVDIKTRQVCYDRNLRALLGYQEHEISNDINEWFYLVHPDDLLFVQQVVDSLISGKESSAQFEYRMIRKNRTVGWISTQINLVRSSNGIPEKIIGASTDITERKLSEHALKKSEEKFRSTFESSGIGMAILGPDARFTKVNKSFCDMTGYSQIEFLQFYLDDVSVLEDYIKVKEIFDLTLENKLFGPQQIEFRLKGKNHNIIWSSTSISLVKDSRQKPLYFIVLFQNITQRKEAEEKLKIYADELKSINSAKDKFFSIISHDLRNPFHTILGASEFLSLYSDDLSIDEFKETASNIYTAAKNVYNLLVNLLEWSRVQTGRLEVNKNEIDLYELFNDVILLHRESADKKQIKLINEIYAKKIIWADKYMLETVLRNLVSNAIKFTNPGGKVVLSNEDIGDLTYIYVSDNGIGISPENQCKLFNYDQQFSLKGTANETGTGLGLAICKEFVEKNGGKILIDSTKGVGSTFKIVLPNNYK